MFFGMILMKYKLKSFAIIKKICDENLEISIYSKTGAYE